MSEYMLDCILGRRSCRQFTDAPVSDVDTQVLLRAGMFAPSATNEQPWSFVLVRSQETMQRLSGVSEYWTALHTCTLVIVVCLEKERIRVNEVMAAQDCSAATENILCAAHGIGLGGVWLGCYGAPGRPEGVAKILGVPDTAIPFSVIALGHPQKTAAAHTTCNEEMIHVERY